MVFDRRFSLADIIIAYAGELSDATKRRIVGFALEQWGRVLSARYYVVRCRCCEASYDAAAWASLDYVGEQDDYEGGALELRNCPCGSTLSKQTKKGR